MAIECTECGASLASDAAVCGYCGAHQEDVNKRLLRELMEVKREFALASARDNKLAMKNLLADEYMLRESDAGSVFQVDKAFFLGSERSGDKNFLSYGIGSEELLDRAGDRATMACVENVTRRRNDTSDNYFWRTKVEFVKRDNRWQILSEDNVTIDENGRDIE